MKLIRISILLMFVMSVICSYGQKNKDGFKIKRGDKLTVMVMDHEEFTIKDISVLPDGYIQFPVLGSVKVAGMTSHELAGRLTGALKRYVVEPIVTVMVDKIENNSINVFGYLNKPGKYLVYTPTDLMTAFSMAGGVKNIRKARKITILRKDGKVETVKLKRNLTKKINKLKRIKPLQPGDTVVVKDPIKIEWGLISVVVAIAHLLIYVS